MSKSLLNFVEGLAKTTSVNDAAFESNIKRIFSEEMLERMRSRIDTRKNEIARSLIVENVAGGLAGSKVPTDFPEGKLAQGIMVELEHVGTSTKKKLAAMDKRTFVDDEIGLDAVVSLAKEVGFTDEDIAIAQDIAMDHLVEDEDYYDKLETIEESAYDYLKGKRTQKTPTTTEELKPRLVKSFGIPPRIEYPKGYVAPKTQTKLTPRKELTPAQLKDALSKMTEQEREDYLGNLEYRKKLERETGVEHPSQLPDIPLVHLVKEDVVTGPIGGKIGDTYSGGPLGTGGATTTTAGTEEDDGEDEEGELTKQKRTKVSIGSKSAPGDKIMDESFEQRVRRAIDEAMSELVVIPVKGTKKPVKKTKKGKNRKN